MPQRLGQTQTKYPSIYGANSMLVLPVRYTTAHPGEKIRMGYRQAGCHPEPDSGPSHFLVCSDHTTCYYDDLVKHETAGRVGNVCSVWYIATAKWSHTPFFAPAPQSASTISFGSALRSWSKNFIDKKYTWPTVNGHRAKPHKASRFDLILQSQRNTEGCHANH